MSQAAGVVVLSLILSLIIIKGLLPFGRDWGRA